MVFDFRINTMFEAKLIQSAIFKKVFDAIKDLLTEAIFECSETGIHVQTMDSSHVSLVCVRLERDGFDKYICKKNVALGINLASMAKIMKCCMNDDVMILRTQDDADKLSIVFESKNNKVSEYELRLMNLDQEHLGIPDTDYTCIVKMPSSEFSKMIKDLSQFGESVTISCSKQGLKFSASGDLGTANIKVAHSGEEGDEGVVIEAHAPVNLTCTIRYLVLFTKATPLSNHIKLFMSADLPILVEYTIGEIGYIRYYLAPKIDDDDQYNNPM